MKKFLGLIVAASLMAGCGGGGPPTAGGSIVGGGPGGGNSNTTLSMGNGTGTSFQAGVIATVSQTLASGGSTVLTTTIVDQNGMAYSAEQVTVTFTSPCISGGQATVSAATTSNGTATTTYVASGCSGSDIVTATATANDQQLSATVELTVTDSYRMGNGFANAFQAGQIGLPAVTGASMLSAGGSTSLSVSIVNQQNVLYAQDSVDVSFNSPCIAQNLATIDTPVTTSTGLASATYVARGCSGDDLVTAIATVGNQTLTATTTLTVAPAAVGSIEFVSATPASIALRGSGGPSRPETSTVIFRVKDSSGGARANTPVRFDLVSTLGGEATFDPATATSDVNGNVQTVVRSGTVATTVAIKATVTTPGTSIFTQSGSLSISTGLTDGNSISLSVRCANVEALNYDGEVVPVTVRMADRFNNPAADGTPANFRTEGGKIGASCLATTTSTESGVCTVNWVSQSPRPTNGRSSLLVSTTGEESFTDSNGNGVYDDGDSGFDDRGEPFLDENEDTARQMSEPFVDFNGNSAYDIVDGLFNGVLCEHTTNCSTQESTAVSDDGVIVLSGSVATITPASGAILPFGTRSFTIRDENNNQMPAGTTVAVSVNKATVVGPASFTWPCSSALGGTTFNFTFDDDDTNPSGTVTLTVTTPAPKSNQTTATYQVGPARM